MFQSETETAAVIYQKPKAGRRPDETMYVCNHRTKGCKSEHKTNMNTENRFEKERGVRDYFAVWGGSEKQLLAPSWDFLPRNSAAGRRMLRAAGLLPGASFLEAHSLFSLLAYLQTPEKMEWLRAFLNIASQKLVRLRLVFLLALLLRSPVKQRF